LTGEKQRKPWTSAKKRPLHVPSVHTFLRTSHSIPRLKPFDTVKRRVVKSTVMELRN